MNSTDNFTFSDFDALKIADYLEFSKNGIPILIFLLILSVVGTIGNVQVLTVYSLRYKASIYKTFVLCLSSVDFIGCVLVIPFLIPYIIHPFTTRSPVLCKLSTALNYFTGCTSLLLLDVIAIERYRKICQATKAQFTVRSARCVCVGGIALGISYSMPYIVTYEINPTLIPKYDNLVGYICETGTAYEDSTFLFSVNVIIFLTFIVLVVLCIILYILVIRNIKKHYKTKHKQQYNITGLSGNQPEQKTEPADTGIKTQKKNSKSESVESNYSFDFTAETSIVTNKHSKIPTRNTIRRRQFKSSRSTTTIFMTVSIISYTSYLPFLIYSVISRFEFFQSFEDNAGAFIPFMKWMGILNNMVNPMVYGFMDAKFRRESSNLYAHMKTRIMSMLHDN